MSLLKYFNELTVNGKPVDEDELEDDYTTDTSEEDEETYKQLMSDIFEHKTEIDEDVQD